MASETLSNWGRWGPNDERGTLNLVTAKNVKDSVSLVRHGKVYSLSVRTRQERTASRYPQSAMAPDLAYRAAFSDAQRCG